MSTGFLLFFTTRTLPPACLSSSGMSAVALYAPAGLKGTKKHLVKRRKTVYIGNRCFVRDSLLLLRKKHFSILYFGVSGL